MRPIFRLQLEFPRFSSIWIRKWRDWVFEKEIKSQVWVGKDDPQDGDLISIVSLQKSTGLGLDKVPTHSLVQASVL